ncbi:MAG: hypothetical protein WDN46_06315 [Methylocella sp.]
MTLSFAGGAAQRRAARAPDEDRPWSPAPKRSWSRTPPAQAVRTDNTARMSDAEPQNDAAPEAFADSNDGDDASPLE